MSDTGLRAPARAGVRDVDVAAQRPSEQRISVWLVVRRWRTMLVAAAVAAGVAGYLVGDARAPTYEARVVLLVGPINTADLDTVRASGQLAQTYAELATSTPLVEATARRLRLSDLRDAISASANEVTRLLTVRARDSDRQRAVQIARAHAEGLLTLVARQGRQESARPGQLQVVEPAQAAPGEIGMSATVIALVAALVGFANALGLALLLDRSTGTVRNADDVSAATGAVSLAELSPRAFSAGRGSALAARKPRSRGAQEFRQLAAKLRAVGDRSLCMMEIDDRAGGVAANLAVAFAAGGSEVALIDAAEDERLKLPEDLSPRVTVHRPEDGEEAPEETIGSLLHQADIVVVRAPGLGQSPSGLVWARAVDGTVLVAGSDRTRRSDLAATVDSLRLVHARVLGTILGARSSILGRR